MAAPVHGTADADDLAAAAAAAAGGQLWELALLRRHESPAVAKAAADLASIPVDGGFQSSSIRWMARACWRSRCLEE